MDIYSVTCHKLNHKNLSDPFFQLRLISFLFRFQDLEEQLSKQLESHTSHQGPVLGNSEIEALRKSAECLKSILPMLGHLEVKFTVPGSEKVAPVGKSLPLLRQEVSVVCSEFESWETGLPREQPIREADTKDMAEGLEALCKEVLLAVQNLIKMERWKEEEKEEKKEENVEEKEEEDEEIDLTAGHITQHLHKELRAELKELRLAKVCMMLSSA